MQRPGRACRRALLLAAWVAAMPGLAAAQDCPPPQTSRPALQALADAGWQLADEARRAQLALALLPCLAAPDPVLRDSFALGALTAWMRAGALPVAVARQVGSHALAVLAAPDGQGFDAPFAALALAEVARADRLQPLWSTEERQRVLEAGTRFLRDTRDRRGFDPVDGWRHAVAHGADLMLQLALNPALGRPQLDTILDAVAAQATPAAHFYVFGEGERLARPVIFIARRGQHDAAHWTAWFGRIALAGRIEPGAPSQLDALARQHNAKALLLPLYAALQESADADMRQRLLPGLSAALRTLW